MSSAPVAIARETVLLRNDKCVQTDEAEAREFARAHAALEKLAFEPEHPVIRTIDLYGRSAQIWPVMYSVFAFEGIDLQTIANNLAARHIGQPLIGRST